MSLVFLAVSSDAIPDDFFNNTILYIINVLKFYLVLVPEA